MPWSLTSTWMPRRRSGRVPAPTGASGPTRTAITTSVLSAVNLTALDTRFHTTWRICRRSPSARASSTSETSRTPRLAAWGAKLATTLSTTSAIATGATSTTAPAPSARDMSSTLVMSCSSWSALPRMVLT